MFIERFMRPSKVAKLLDVSKATIYRWFWEGKLTGVKFGEKRSIRIHRESVLKLIGRSDGES